MEIVKTFKLPLVSQTDAYIRYVYSIPFLDEKEEFNLGQNVKKFNDSQSALKLIAHHLRLSVKVAKKHSGYGLPIEDLIQEGNIGLMKAVKKFDPDKNVRLATLALIWIQSEIRAYILKNWRMVKVATTKKFIHLFFSFRQLKNNLEGMGFSGESLYLNLAEKLNIKREELYDIENRFIQESSIEDEYDFKLIELSVEESIINQQNIKNLYYAINDLNERDKEIIQLRFFEDWSVNNIAKKFNISNGRVTQIINENLQLLKKRLN